MAMRGARSSASEFVTDGHPDKVCDQMADAIVDAAMEQDPKSRVAMEVTGGHGGVVVIGEMTTKAIFDVGEVCRKKYREIGHADALGVFTNIVRQSPDISQGVDEGRGMDLEQGAGDQGIMTGYAVADGPMLMPLSHTLARALCVRMRELGTTGQLPWMRPDGKSIVVVNTEGLVTHVTLAAHHSSMVNGVEIRPDDPQSEKRVLEMIREELTTHCVRETLRDRLVPDAWIVVNGTGKFVQGGFEADAGTTGRKLAVDNYGPNIEIGGGAYSGKDPSKVDRSAAYFCRMVAKSIVAGGHAQEALVKVGYAIGQSRPVYISVETPLVPQCASLEAKVREKFDFRPKAINEQLGLLTPKGWCYQDTAAMGHYGDARFPWEQVVEL
ncbi:MAG: methionine adenosyltransferase [bacterium]|nr:methionine adenosyltransferase [bacterium]